MGSTLCEPLTPPPRPSQLPQKPTTKNASLLPPGPPSKPPHSGGVGGAQLTASPLRPTDTLSAWTRNEGISGGALDQSQRCFRCSPCCDSHQVGLAGCSPVVGLLGPQELLLHFPHPGRWGSAPGSVCCWTRAALLLCGIWPARGW